MARRACWMKVSGACAAASGVDPVTIAPAPRQSVASQDGGAMVAATTTSAAAINPIHADDETSDRRSAIDLSGL